MTAFRIAASRSLLGGAALLCIALIVSPGRSATLYAVGGSSGLGSGQSGLYTVNETTGIMTFVGSPHVGGNYNNSIYNGGLAYDPYTDRMYALGCDSSNASALFLVDRTDASMVRLGYCTPLHPGAFCSGGLAFDLTTRRLFAVGDLALPPYQRTSLVELNTSTGAATIIGDNNPAGTYMSGLGCDPVTGVLYANGYKSFDQASGLFSLDKGSGAATLVGYHGLTLGRRMNYSGLAVSPTTGDMYGFGSHTGSINHLYRVNKSTGAVTSVAPQSPNGVGVDGALVYVGTDILGVGPAASAASRLRAWPNPARAEVSFTFGLPRAGRVTLGIFDLAGRRVATVTSGDLGAGQQSLHWNRNNTQGERIAAGLYFATLRSDAGVIGRVSVMLAE